VRVTLGPRGRNVVLDRGAGAPTITNDGLTIAREIELADPFENMGAQLAREAATKTGEVAGDGTTTATVLAYGVIRRGLQAITAGHNPVALRRGIERAVSAVVEDLRARSRPVESREAIARVATVSANDDPAIGALVAEAVERVGRQGVITVEEGRGMETSLDVVEGVRIEGGYLSPYFVTHPDTMEAALENPLVLLTEYKCSGARDLMAAMECAARAGRPLLVIAEDVEGEALATLVVNRLRGTVSSVAVKTPLVGERRRALFEDLAVLTGARVVSAELGTKLDQVAEADLGRARKAIIDREHTTLVEGGGRDAAIRERIGALERELKHADSDYDKDELRQRLGRLSGGVAVIRVGAPTEVAMAERRSRIEDALAATRAALEEGVVVGGARRAAARAGRGARARGVRRRRRGAGHRARGARGAGAPDRGQRRRGRRGDRRAHPRGRRRRGVRCREWQAPEPRRGRDPRSHEGHALGAPARREHRLDGAHDRCDRGGRRRGNAAGVRRELDVRVRS